MGFNSGFKGLNGMLQIPSVLGLDIYRGQYLYRERNENSLIR